MHGKALQATAQKRAEELPATTLYSFEPGWEAARVVDKWFMLVTEVPGRPVVILKSRPDDAQALCEAYTDITPGYHMNKRHWITLSPGDSIDKRLVEELVTESYRLVVANLPKSRRPVDPARFGTG
ncbi:MmcQ/YjbR family DNA-binding protein [Actinomadura sp. NAK00032]|uniref:MmcQ/YjbR family DNA-binding protein n=1 Tax=Actinomadura sp. NAK00032 TaxID=2742128 RepID=UPI001591A2FF|nr:MmcQ/YjbR family DNA-binding protein [Actinomadura sp. NAK00032]QKW38007.1 MmcQ/YjbR family DNA-binding protein [Actinomadura sp. NAK00032]